MRAAKSNKEPTFKSNSELQFAYRARNHARKRVIRKSDYHFVVSPDKCTVRRRPHQYGDSREDPACAYCTYKYRFGLGREGPIVGQREGQRETERARERVLPLSFFVAKICFA